MPVPGSSEDVLQPGKPVSKLRIREFMLLRSTNYVPEPVQSWGLPESRGMSLLDMSDPIDPEHPASAGGMRSAKKKTVRKATHEHSHGCLTKQQDELAGSPAPSLLYAQQCVSGEDRYEAGCKTDDKLGLAGGQHGEKPIHSSNQGVRVG